MPLPLYALVRADGTSIASFPGLTRKPEEFVDFLRRGLAEQSEAMRFRTMPRKMSDRIVPMD